jgi:hypothetical protein
VGHLFSFWISKISLKEEKGAKSMYTKCVQQRCQYYKAKEHVSMNSNKEELDTSPWAEVGHLRESIYYH